MELSEKAIYNYCHRLCQWEPAYLSYDRKDFGRYSSSCSEGNVQFMTGIDEHGQKSQPINKKMGFLKKNNAIKSLRTSNVPAMYSTFLTIII